MHIRIVSYLNFLFACFIHPIAVRLVAFWSALNCSNNNETTNIQFAAFIWASSGQENRLEIQMWYKRGISLNTWIWCLFKFFELCDFHHSAWTNRRPIKCVILTVQVALLYRLTSNGVTFTLATSNYMDGIGVLNFTLLYAAALINYWIIVIESFAQKPAQEAFWRIHGQLDDSEQSKSMKRIFLCKFGIHLIMSAVLIALAVQNKKTANSSILTFYTLLFMCNNQLFYFLLYLKLIKLELTEIDGTLKCWRYYACPRRYRKVLNRICGQYQRAHELTTCTNTLFGWSNFATILVCFFTLFTYLDWIYKQHETHQEGYGSLSCWLIIVPQQEFLDEKFDSYRIFHADGSRSTDLHALHYLLPVQRGSSMWWNGWV